MQQGTGKTRVMIAGIGGASLGTEILKSLLLTDNYELYGCDISPMAYGLYDEGFTKTFLVKREDYASEIMNLCARMEISCLIPGGEEPNILLAPMQTNLLRKGIHFITNAANVVETCSDKALTFARLKECGVNIPRTISVQQISDITNIELPCIVKPATGSGGSVSVFYAATVDEVLLYTEFIKKTGHVPIVQEYVDLSEGEFTIGVLSLPDGSIVDSIVLRRIFDAKLSCLYKEKDVVISSGYSQGYIDDFSEIAKQAEKIALALGSRGPVNIQGRVRKGVLLPFEVNPRFSASTFLRAKAGFNEIDMYLQYVLKGIVPNKPVIKAGWYLRSLTERFIPQEDIKSGH